MVYFVLEAFTYEEEINYFDDIIRRFSGIIFSSTQIKSLYEG